MFLLATYSTNYLALILAILVITLLMGGLLYWRHRQISSDQPANQISLQPQLITIVLASIPLVYLFNQLARALQRAQISLMDHGLPPSLLSVSLWLSLILWVIYVSLSLVVQGKISKLSLFGSAAILLAASLILSFL